MHLAPGYDDSEHTGGLRVPQPPAVVAIILTWNQKEDTLRCLRSFDTVEYPRLELVLVDNASTDGTSDAVRNDFPRVHLVRNPVNAGVAGGRNAGIDYANRHLAYDYLLFIDNDTVVTSTFLRPLVDALQADRLAGIATPKGYLIDREGVLDSAGGADLNMYTGSMRARGHGERDHGQYDAPTRPAVPGGIALVRREVVEICGGFDPTFGQYGPEDLDFALRARAHGFRFRFVPTAIVFHRGSKTGFKGYSPEYAALKGRNIRRFIQRHATPLQRWCFHALLPLLALRTISREVVRGNLKAPIALVRGYFRG